MKTNIFKKSIQKKENTLNKINSDECSQNNVLNFGKLY